MYSLVIIIFMNISISAVIQKKHIWILFYEVHFILKVYITNVFKRFQNVSNLFNIIQNYEF
ncbi:hypothetical protein EK616_11035 [Escherichia coli]|nr:hypothetical protein [Escherichia coli]EEV7150963.1 hypothetical protein [Escherichia coli]EEW7482012.1 hypothetical protein [Escherichia coli]EEY5221796.1 hypothetical protein [Escherichia coli]EGE1481430.1 hypothetical protein [Escherichia coli]